MGFDAISSMRDRLIGAERDRNDLKSKLENEQLKVTGTDLDETRRLLYMALMSSRTERYVLAGTLVNALAHHNLNLDADDTMNRLVDLLKRGASDDAVAWARDIINQLTARMEEQADPELSGFHPEDRS